MTTTTHHPTYEVDKDPEGNSWTVTCSCGSFQEHGSTRQVVRGEFRDHKATGQEVVTTTPDATPDLVDQIIAYECDELDDDATIALFQGLVDSGTAWQLQGHYGRTATALIDAGLVTRPS